MKSNAITGSILALALLLPLSACSQSSQGDTGANGDVAKAMQEVRQKTSPSAIAAEVQKGIAQAKQELLTQDLDVTNVRVGKDGHGDHDGRPKAAITPQGDLLIAGSKVDATPAQHALLVDYRQQVIGVAEAGMDIGPSAAELGVGAAREAIFGALVGKSDKDIEAGMQPQIAKIQAAALRLCKKLPDLLASQQKLAAAMPTFQPYATMTQKDVDDCGKDIADGNGKRGFAVFSD